MSGIGQTCEIIEQQARNPRRARDILNQPDDVIDSVSPVP